MTCLIFRTTSRRREVHGLHGPASRDEPQDEIKSAPGCKRCRELARDDRCAIMCAEAVWWRCHRRIITDYLLAGGTRVEHIMGPGQVVSATFTPGARVLADGTLRYPAPDGAI